MAEMDGYITRNVARQVDLPKGTKKEVTTLSPAQARLFLEAVAGDRLRAFYWTALLLGLRKGEVCGLRLVDLSFRDETITPTYTVQWQAGKLVLSDLKTAGSHAPMMLPASLIPVLHQHLAHLAEEQSGADWQECGLLFPNRRGTLLEPSNVSIGFKRILAKAGLPEMCFHQLRHTCGTLLAELREPVHVIQAVLWHASPRTTAQYYLHSRDEVQRVAVDGLGMLLTEPERTRELPTKVRLDR
ncbi:MAG: site-specific integrase [Chloroflexi bacterium AL-W]|nr:site-specific integrase [Chloroflexi bacterium AL-N1]NOK68566.1 site-specific integrase [Chloroflexi bacterium AL-N10]NOK76052.1 site-specific integrase [Chloroflexi bacterium AL-N5]NOK82525.1 site-specific integrase [Chloroflexi bacterium AL-W]NOK92835.1 site-specific integrase [Chloroflexi bacterium AL-N15]